MYRNQFREARRDSPGENAGASFTSLGLKVIPEEVDASKKCHNLATLHGLQSSYGAHESYQSVHCGRYASEAKTVPRKADANPKVITRSILQSR